MLVVPDHIPSFTMPSHPPSPFNSSKNAVFYFLFQLDNHRGTEVQDKKTASKDGKIEYFINEIIFIVLILLIHEHGRPVHFRGGCRD